jgi:hypothetical protein
MQEAFINLKRKENINLRAELETCQKIRKTIFDKIKRGSIRLGRGMPQRRRHEANVPYSPFSTSLVFHTFGEGVEKRGILSEMKLFSSNLQNFQNN